MSISKLISLIMIVGVLLVVFKVPSYAMTLGCNVLTAVGASVECGGAIQLYKEKVSLDEDYAYDHYIEFTNDFEDKGYDYEKLKLDEDGLANLIRSTMRSGDVALHLELMEYFAKRFGKNDLYNELDKLENEFFIKKGSYAYKKIVMEKLRNSDDPDDEKQLELFEDLEQKGIDKWVVNVKGSCKKYLGQNGFYQEYSYYPFEYEYSSYNYYQKLSQVEFEVPVLTRECTEYGNIDNIWLELYTIENKDSIYCKSYSTTGNSKKGNIKLNDGSTLYGVTYLKHWPLKLQDTLKPGGSITACDKVKLTYLGQSNENMNFKVEII